MRCLGRRMRTGIPSLERNEFRPSRVMSLLTPKSRVMLLNFPNNLTGLVLARKEAMQLAEFAAEHDMLVISDEVYENVTYDRIKH
jgi:aminotransferase